MTKAKAKSEDKPETSTAEAVVKEEISSQDQNSEIAEAIPTPVNGQITDSVTQTDTEKTGETASNEMASDKAAPQPEQKRAGSPMLSLVALIIAGGAIAAGYTAYQQLNIQQSALSQRVDSTEQSVATIESTSNNSLSKAETLNSRVSSLEGQVNSGLSQIKQNVNSELSQLKQNAVSTQSQLQQINAAIDKLNETLKKKHDDEWLAAEARHLIKIANHQAQLNYNPKAAMAALEAADQRLRDAADPALLEVRKSLTDNIIALRGVSELDITGIALTLNQLENRVAQLSFTSAVGKPATEHTATTEASGADISSVDGFFAKIWGEIKGLVSVRHDDSKTTSAMLPPGQQFFLQQNLRLKLETARLALLQRDTQTFQDTLATANQWLKTYFDTDTTAVANMINSLAPYEKLDLQPAIPDISSSLRALDSWQQQRNANSTAAANQEVSAS